MPNKILPLLDSVICPQRTRHNKKNKKSKTTTKPEQNNEALISKAAADAVKANSVILTECKKSVNDAEVLIKAQEIKQKSEQIKQSLEVEKIHHKVQKYTDEAKKRNFAPVYDNNGNLIREYKYSNHRRNTYLPNYTVTDYKDGKVARKYFIVLYSSNPADVIDYHGNKFKQFRFVNDKLVSYAEGEITGDNKVINRQFRYSASDNSLYTYREGIRKIDDSKSSVEKTFKFDSVGNLEDYIEDSTCYINAYGY